MAWERLRIHSTKSAVPRNWEGCAERVQFGGRSSSRRLLRGSAQTVHRVGLALRRRHSRGAEPRIIARTEPCLKAPGNRCRAPAVVHFVRWYDIPRDAVTKMEQLFRDSIAAHGLDATITVSDRQMPHRERVTLALGHGGGAGEIQLQGVWTAVCGGIPTDREFPVSGEPMRPRPDQERWRRIYVASSSRLSASRRSSRSPTGATAPPSLSHRASVRAS